MPKAASAYQVKLIRQMKKEGFQQRFLLKLFGISKSSLRNILILSTYKDVH